ncbi:MAG: hypothetical protein K8F91_13850, partial [Candidatus Obscuribacterales bacterium]|nr:hypothetical protein [Candidatus Obscuribacterales bacterium]
MLCATSVPLAYCQPVDANSEKTNQNPQELNSTLALSADEKVTAGEKPSDPPESTPPSKIQSDENQSASSRNSGKRESAATKVDNASGDTTTKSSDTDISTETDTNAGTSDSTILDRFDLGRPGGIFAPRSPARDSLLKGTISTFSGRTPLLSGSVQVVPVDTKIELVIPDGVYINSEVSQKGDEIMVRIGKDVLGEGGKVVLPGGWYARGLITQAACQRRLGRDGYLDIKFDKLVSPDGEYEVDFDAQFSTKDSKLKSVAKVVAIDSGYV